MSRTGAWHCLASLRIPLTTLRPIPEMFKLEFETDNAAFGETDCMKRSNRSQRRLIDLRRRMQAEAADDGGTRMGKWIRSQSAT